MFLLSLLLITAHCLHTSSAYEIVLGLLLPRDFKDIADFARKDANGQIFNGTPMKMVEPKWEDFRCDNIVPIGLTSKFHYHTNRTNSNGGAGGNHRDIL